MPRPQTPLPFTAAFTLSDVERAQLTPRVLHGWLQRGDVVEIGRGNYAPANSQNLERDRRIHINHLITDGRQPVTFEAAALLHCVCTPTSLPPRHKVPQRIRDLPEEHLQRRGRLLVPSRELTVLELARWQKLPSALIPFECWRRSRPNAAATRTMQELVQIRSGWPGMRAVDRAFATATGLCDSALESFSLGLIVDSGLPRPEQQVRFEVDGYVYYVDFLWRDRRLIGEADGALKYDSNGRAQFDERRRQARLQSLGFEVMRWGWPELRPHPQAWLRSLEQRLLH